NQERERVGLHDFRHTLIALAFEHGLTLPEASILAQHANPRATAQVYAGLSETARERVAEKLAESGFGALTRSRCKQDVSPNSSEPARTLANLAMQKVVGSSPIIRSVSTCKSAGVVVWEANAKPSWQG